MFSTLVWAGPAEGGAMLFIAKAGTYTVDDGVPEMLRGEDVTVRYSAEKWDALQLSVVESSETTIVVAENTGPRFLFPRMMLERLKRNLLISS